MLDYFLRFFFGGLFVSAFSVIGDSFKPKTFSGIFAAAPSIALASLILIWHQAGPGEVATQSRFMICGAAALIFYNLLCSFVVQKDFIPPWLAAGVLWLQWFITAYAFYLLEKK